MYVTHAEIDSARQHYRQAPWSTAWKHLLHIESTATSHFPHRVDKARFNWLLEQTRLNAKYLHTLVVLWSVQPTDRRMAAIIAMVEDILSWPQWSLEHSYDLSTGELSVCLCGLLNWMDNVLPQDLVHRTEAMLAQRILEPFHQTTVVDGVWWNKTGSNWVAVCHAGGYAVANRLHTHPLAPAAAEKAWQCIVEYVRMQPQDGGSSESLSYWQYGTRYLTYALLIYHQRHGRFPDMVAEAPLCHGINFYRTFMRNGAAIGFGDCSYSPPEALLLKFCDIVGDAEGRQALEQMLVAYLDGELLSPKPRFLWNQPREAQMLLFLQNCRTHYATAKTPPKRVDFPETGWYALHAGELTAAFRTGDNTSGHAMSDQLAINVSAEDVTLIGYMENHPYSSGWFNNNGESTRQHYFEEQSVSKNTIAINGIGQIRRGVVTAHVTENSVRADATALYPKYVTMARRTVRASDGQLEIFDEIATDEPCWHEIRFFTEGNILLTGDASVRIDRNGKFCEIRFDSDQPLRLVPTEIVPSIGVRPSWRLLRVSTENAGYATEVTTRISRDLPVKSMRVGELPANVSILNHR